MIDFQELQIEGAKDANLKRHHHNTEAKFFGERAAELFDWASRPEMNRARIEYRPGDWGQPYNVFIPPFRENHFDGDSIVGPFGDTDFATWEEAKTYFDEVIAEVEAGKYGEGWTA